MIYRYYFMIKKGPLFPEQSFFKILYLIISDYSSSASRATLLICHALALDVLLVYLKAI